MYEALCIGLMSGLLTFLSLLSLERLSIDDPCGSFVVHGLNGAWGLIALGLVAKDNLEIMEYNGLFYGGTCMILYI